ncbi:UDP-glucose/GDP-mannose dehydrogenase family protein [Gammaproteobacteria bacterium]|nr:UDP-glucose/GDP-mannose dehydrogenase family protein [Gammaproteobacteria bacterium]
MKISIIGTGYVGLVSAACFAELGHSVLAIDNNKSKINSLSKGKSTIYEPGLDEIMKKNIQCKRLSFSTSYIKACQADLLVLCIDTPAKKSGEPDLKNLKLALKSIAARLKKDTFIVTKSTVPIGTNKFIKNYFTKVTNYKVEIISNPEFLKEGCAVEDFFNPYRIIIGFEGNASKKIMDRLYSKLKISPKKIYYMKIESAELTKYASNSFLATKISFINRISQISDLTNADIHEIKIGMGSDPRIGGEFLNAGLGFGGSCFPKDIQALRNIEKKLNLDHSILSAVEEINDQQFEIFYKKIINSIPKMILRNTSFLIWGLSFKPDTDDIRHSIALKLVRNLATKVKNLYLYDPVAMGEASNLLKHYKNISFCKSPFENIKNANALIICTEWDEFKNVDLAKLKLLKDKKIFDGRNMLNKNQISQLGIEYFGLGV